MCECDCDLRASQCDTVASAEGTRHAAFAQSIPAQWTAVSLRSLRFFLASPAKCPCLCCAPGSFPSCRGCLLLSTFFFVRLANLCLMLTLGFPFLCSIFLLLHPMCIMHTEFSLVDGHFFDRRFYFLFHHCLKYYPFTSVMLMVKEI